MFTYIDGVKYLAPEEGPLKPDTAYMEVPRCDRCRFWENRPVQVGPVTVPIFECTRQFSAGAQIGVGASGGAAIYTDADFGCVQFEARQSEEQKP